MKTFKKRLLPLLLALALSLGLLPVTALADDPQLYDVYQGNGFYITVTPYKLNSTKYRIVENQSAAFRTFYDGYLMVETADVDENYVNRRFVSEYNLADRNGNIVLPAGLMTKPGDSDLLRRYWSGRYIPSEGLVAFWDGKATAGSDELLGFLDYRGSVVIPPQFRENDVEPFSDGYARASVKVGESYEKVIIDRTGQIVLRSRNGGATTAFHSDFGSGLICVSQYKDGAYVHGYMNMRGEMVLPLVTSKKNIYGGDCWSYYAAGELSGYLMPFPGGSQFSEDGYAVVADLRSGDRLAYTYAVIDTSGNVVGTFRDMEPVAPFGSGSAGFHDGLLRVAFIDNRGNKSGYGYVDTAGNVAWREGDFSAGGLDAGGDYHCGVTVMRWGCVVDTKGNIVIPAKTFDEYHDFNDNLSLAKTGGQYYLLEIHQGSYTGSGRLYNYSQGGVGEKPPASSAKYTTSAQPVGTTTVQVRGETKTVNLYPAGTVFTLSAGVVFGALWPLGGTHISMHGKTAFTLLDDGNVYEMFLTSNSGSSEYVYAKASGSSQQPAGALAYASTQSVDVDGRKLSFQMYALKDANGNPTNYIKLRDVAFALNGTAAQFEVGWDGAVNIRPGQAYTPNGSEMSTPFSGDRAYEPATSETRINATAANLEAIVLKDDQGGAYTYYKLRDLGKALGFNVGWSGERGIFVETDKPYQD